jgi:beta-ureidopropionase / N-carbamoyl-L-amino-acid hydrolase
MGFDELWRSLLPIGRDPATGGYRRFVFSEPELAARSWFMAAAARRGLDAECDRNANLWAWWRPADPAAAARPAVAAGSHLDSVPDGGGYDGPLGVVSAFAAIDRLREQGVTPARPVAVAAFAEEEGARFGVACLGSRLLTGVVDGQEAARLTDSAGVSLAQAMTGAGLDPAGLGPDGERLGRIGAYVELHIEQGRGLAGLGAAVGVAEGIWPHGRWRLEFTGRADHAGTTALGDRRDPMLPCAAAVQAARQAARGHGALATVSKVITEPGGANGINSAVSAWLDARAPDAAALEAVTGEVQVQAQAAADEHRVTLAVRRESFSPPVSFDPVLRSRVAAAVARACGDPPALPTGAGHDAGVLAARLPAAMLFVRNPTGVSHAPDEHATAADCASGVDALAAVLADLAGPR